ncbi:MAG: hypothetical protein Q9217_002929 [Psora testacea]
MDLSNKTAILRLILPQVPFLARTAFWHTFYLSPTSTKWDLRTELVVKLIRSLLNSPSPRGALAQQRATLKDPGIKGKLWLSQISLPAPGEDDVRRVFLNAIDGLKTSPLETYSTPVTVLVDAEWTGYRPNVDSHRPRPDLSEQQHYRRLMSDTTSPVTVLYFHGGAFFLMDPATHRDPVSYLARLTGGRCLNVRYRLSPQNAFPAALLDAFIAYLCLLYPPPDSYHDPVSASHIVFAGDSAGGNLALSLLQLLLQINRSVQNTKATSLRFHNYTIDLPIPIPAGCAPHSAWTDMTHCMPSKLSNREYDYLPAPITREKVSSFPSDEIWPTKPPRGDLYCETNMLCHPLVSPLAAKDWRGSCPMWMGYGEEMLVDEGKQIASLAAKQGVSVRWEEWEAMCHCFGMVLVGSAMSKKLFQNWAGFCKDVVGMQDYGGVDANGTLCEEKGGKGVQTKGTFYEAKTLVERVVDIRVLAVLTDEEVAKRMRTNMEKRHLVPEDATKVMPKL